MDFAGLGQQDRNPPRRPKVGEHNNEDHGERDTKKRSDYPPNRAPQDQGDNDCQRAEIERFAHDIWFDNVAH